MLAKMSCASSVTTTYDALNRPLSVTADGATRTYFYDYRNRWSGAVRGSATDSIFTDLAGRDSVIIAARGSRVYTQRLAYGDLGARVADTLVHGAYHQTTTMDYDVFGRLKHLTDPSGHGFSELGYDVNGFNVTRDVPGMSFVTGFSGVHAPTALSYGNTTLNREYAYEPRFGFLRDRIRADSGARYTYDDFGQLAGVYRYTVDDSAHVCGSVLSATGEMLSVCSNRLGSGGPVLVKSFAYDSVGNRKDAYGYTHTDDANRLSSWNYVSYGNDFDGNRSSSTDGVSNVTFTWSAEGELKKKQRSYWNGSAYVTDSTTFTYDGFGRRIGKYSNLTGGHGYLHDGDNLLAELDTAGNILTHYTYYPGVDVPHSVFLPGRMQTYYMATEVPGNVTGLMTPGGVLAASWEYDEWGTPRTLSGADSIPMPLRFAAREYDSETGLYYNRARYYDPVTARFISEDPGGITGGLNLYTYAGNNPVNETDPSGMRESFCWIEASYWGCGWQDGMSSGGLLSYGKLQVDASSSGSSDNFLSAFARGGFGLGNLGQVVNGIAGFGDGASFGATVSARAIFGGNENVDFDSPVYRASAVAGLAIGLYLYGEGAELKIGNNFRIAPYGNRTGNPLGELPHYHRRITDSFGETIEGGGIGRHRPWESTPAGTPWWRRF